MDKMEINAIKGIWGLISRTNKYIDETAQLLAKDEAKAARLEAVMYNLAEVLRIVAILITPFVPHTSPKIYTQLGLTVPALFMLADAAWGGLADGTIVQKGEPIYPRIEINEEGVTVTAATKKTAAPAPAAAKAVEQPKQEEEEISIDDFAKIDLRVATILTAERVPKTDKLMKLSVKIGDEERIIVSGIAQHYTEERNLVGRNVIVIANLKAANRISIESRGMLLAASDGQGNLILADAPGIASGSKVK